MKLDDDAINAVCYRYALEHYSERFDKSIDDPHVMMNAKSNWYIFERDARSFITKYLNAMNELKLVHAYNALNKAG